MGKVRKLDPRWRILSIQAALHRRRIRYLSRDPRPIAFTARWGIAFIHRCLRFPGRWRCTWLDHDMQPTGHVDNGMSFPEALRRAHEEGAHLFNELPRTEKVAAQ
jgi:hypothetical protein